MLERHGDQLRSIALTWGSFMPLHDGDGGWTTPPSTLSAVHGSNGRPTGLASLSGQGISQLSRPAARHLLACLLAEPSTPRRRGVTDLASNQPPLLLLHLLLNIPAKQGLSLNQPGRWGLGLVDRRSQSTAIVSLRSPWGNGDTTPERRARWRLDAYGGDTAAAQLNELVTQWRELEHAGQTKLRITARGRASPLDLSFAWGETYH